MLTNCHRLYADLRVPRGWEAQAEETERMINSVALGVGLRMLNVLSLTLLQEGAPSRVLTG